MNKFFDGFKFGIILQIAVGPICFLIFQISVSNGTIPAILGTLGVTLVDALYILLAVLGIGKFIEENENTKKLLNHFSSLVLIIFGFYIFISAIKTPYLPINKSANILSKNPFISASLLTISNPLTIIFWTGIFASKTTSENMNLQELSLFGLGSIASTLIFLSFISILGHYTKIIVNENIIIFLNILVALLLVSFGMKPYLNNLIKIYQTQRIKK